jgi:lysophospholipase L1-like esterase
LLSPLTRWLLIGVAVAVLVATGIIGGVKLMGLHRPPTTRVVATTVTTAPVATPATPAGGGTQTMLKNNVPAPEGTVIPPAPLQDSSAPSPVSQVTPQTVADNDPPAGVATPGRDYVILQIGDSHTAADLFTGEVRDRLQEKFGAGGLFLPPGIPKAGVQSAEFTIRADDAWQYQAMASTDEPNHFWLSGYTATAHQESAHITFAARGQQAYDSIDVSFLKAPGGGQADILLDGKLVDHVSLDGPPGDPLIKRLLPGDKVASFKTLDVVTTSAGEVTLSGVFVDQRQSGVSYLSVGFPGAKASVLKRMTPANFADDMARLNPDMVILAFGTNEGFDDNLDPDEYKRNLGSILSMMMMGNPKLKVVLIGPPPGVRKEDSCANVHTACGTPPVSGACWAQPPKLTAVRDAEREVAKEMGAYFWDWSSVLPTACALEEGHLGDPAIFGPDRIHMTPKGYRDSADAFAGQLIPLISKFMGS